MRRRRRLGGLPLAALLVLWAACAVLHVRQVAAGKLAWVGVYVTGAAGPEDVPTVRGFWPGAPSDARGALAVGDRLVRVGDADLRGADPIAFVARVQAAVAARPDLQAVIGYERAGVAATTPIALVPVAYPWRMLPLTATLVATAALVLWRRRSRLARSFFLLAVAFGLHWTFFFGGPTWQTEAWAVVFFAASLVMLPAILRTLLLFPPEVAPPGGRLPWWPWTFAVFGPISLSWVFGLPLPPETGFRAAFAVNVAFIVTMLAVMTRSYRRAGALGRRQLKWVLLGLYVGTVPVLAADVAGAVVPALVWLHEAAAIAEIVIPLSVLVAIVRTNLFDVDRLISSTATYSILSILLVAVALVAVPSVAEAVSAAGGLDPQLVQPVLSLVAAAGIVPGHRFLQPRLERVLFRERHALRTGVETLLRDLSGAPDPQALLTLLGERLEGLVRPQTCVIWTPLGGAFAPVFARGLADGVTAPTVSGDADVVAALRARNAPIDVASWARGRPAAERAALEASGAAIVVPVRRGGDLAGAIGLGPKRSGDVYTPTDLALLGAVADKVSGELLRFDTAVILAQERAMREALRRYVPEPVAARLTRGQSIEGGERDVAVLFVDIRGYTTYSEQETADAVFSMVNRYTEAVSAVIQRCGGTVVEFLGDGLMAVFGAPEPMADHAGAAVRAACEVVTAVRGLALGRGDGGAPITVGVGVASGRAFVGNVRTNDRLVYTAIGDVVNLASRIERLTRELDAAVAIDAATHGAAGAASARFRRHPRMPIRGRAEPVDVWALPVAAA